jgi:hypothetical protein
MLVKSGPRGYPTEIKVNSTVNIYFLIDINKYKIRKLIA